MAITQTQIDGIERVQVASGSYLDDAGSPDAAAISIGFDARKIEVVNETDRITFEWYYGQTTANGIKTAAAGTRTLETSGLITVVAGSRGFGFPVIQNKQYRWRAIS